MKLKQGEDLYCKIIDEILKKGAAENSKTEHNIFEKYSFIECESEYDQFVFAESAIIHIDNLDIISKRIIYRIYDSHLVIKCKTSNIEINKLKEKNRNNYIEVYLSNSSRKAIVDIKGDIVLQKKNKRNLVTISMTI